MKNLALLFILAFFIQSIASSQSCLPEGITFSTQEQIDNFQTNYPNCTEIEGNVSIREPEIANLDGLNILTSIEGNLQISGTYSLTGLSGLHNLNFIGGNFSIQHNINALTNLSGLESLTSIEGNLQIGDLNELMSSNSLTSLIGLEGLTSIGGDLLIYRNLSLTNLTGLDNLSSIGGALSIIGNNDLSGCEAQWLCNYLSNPNGSVNIYNNATGCNNPPEIASACGINLPCLPYGNYYLFSQADIDNFQINYPNCTEIEGNVKIYGYDITNLNGLSVLTSIGGDLLIGGSVYLGNSSLKSLTGLDGLTSIGGDLLIYNNDSLTSLSGLSNITSIGGSLFIGLFMPGGGGGYGAGNPLLTDLTGLEGLTSIEGDLSIKFNNALTSLTGLESLTSIGGNLKIGYMTNTFNNPNLTSLIGLEGLTSIGGDLNIESNDALITLTGLDNVTSIGGDLLIYGNDSLTSLSGLENVTSVNGNLHIGRYSTYYYNYGNPILTSLAGLEGLTFIGGELWIEENDALPILTGLDNVISIGGDLYIYNNATLPSLTGLDNVTSISGGLYVTYGYLTSLTGLDNVTSIGGDLTINNNPALTNLSGLDNIGANSITDLYIYNNSSLSSCEAQWLCNYLSNPNGSVNIYGNAPGCNNPPEIASACGITLTCLPYGNYYFSYQTDVDNFLSNYGNCIELEGDVTISGDDITNLNGLNDVTSIGGSLHIIDNPVLTSLTGLNNVISIGGSIEIVKNLVLQNLSGLENITLIPGNLSIGNYYNNSSLTSLTGLENVTSIGGYIYIHNQMALTSLTGLENVTSIGESLSIYNNDILTSLTGLDNINANSITDLAIIHNDFLSSCEVQSICDYLASPNGSISIHFNAPGCDNKYEVEEACIAVSVDEVKISDKLVIYPNPSSSQITIELPTTPQKNAFLTIYSINAQQLLTRRVTEQKTVVDVSGLPTGFYFIKVEDNRMVMVGKMVKR